MDDVRWGYPMHLSERVEQLLDEGTLTEIIRFVEAELKESWVKTPHSDTQEREFIYQQLHALNHIEIKLATILAALKNQRGDYSAD